MQQLFSIVVARLGALFFSCLGPVLFPSLGGFSSRLGGIFSRLASTDPFPVPWVLVQVETSSAAASTEVLCERVSYFSSSFTLGYDSMVYTLTRVRCERFKLCQHVELKNEYKYGPNGGNRSVFEEPTVLSWRTRSCRKRMDNRAQSSKNRPQ